MLSQGFLGMADREFWGDPRGTDQARQQMIAAGYEGIALDGPREIPTQATEWPLVACERCPTHEGPEARLESLAALVAIDPDADQMWVGRAYPARVFDTSKRPQKPALEPDDEDDEDDDWDDDPESFEVEDDGAPDMLTDDDLSPEELAAAAGEEVGGSGPSWRCRPWVPS